MRRWLVALAMTVVAMPDGEAEARHLKVELATRAVTTSKTAPLHGTSTTRVAQLPASVELDAGAVSVRANGKTVRHRLGQRDGLSWIVRVGDHVVIGFAAHRGGHADTMLAIDHRTGAVAWRRSVDSLFAAELVDHWLAVERAGSLDIVDVRSGKTAGTTPIAGQSIQAVCRLGTGDLHLKTHGDLIAIDRKTGAVRWVVPTSSIGNAALTPTAVVDGWVDRTTHRFGIVTYDPVTGRRLESIDLGETGGWYDLERVELAPDGAREVLVSAMFAVE